MSDRKAIVNGVDITRHVAAMYDAIIQSADWGSDFLDTEEIASILTVGTALGFDVPRMTSLPEDYSTKGAPPQWHRDPELRERYGNDHRAWRTEQIAKWQAQVNAMITANLGGEGQS